MSDDSRDEYDGSCACGAVRYRVTAKPMFVNCCHCRWCQRESGAAFALNAMVETSRIVLLKGQPDMIDTPSESGAGQVFARCPDCRVALWSHYQSAGDKVAFIRVGSLDDPDRMPPDAHIFTESKQPWLKLSDGLPVFERYYDRETTWPAESVARRKAAIEG